MHLAAPRCSHATAGIDQALGQTLARERGNAGGAAEHQRLPHHRAEQARQRQLRLGVQRGDGERLDQAAIEGVAALQTAATVRVVGDAATGRAARDSQSHACRARGACATTPTRGSGRGSGAASSVRPSLRSMNGNTGSVRAVQRGAARRCGRDSRTRRDCPTAADGCRCRCAGRARGRNTTGNARRRPAPPRRSVTVRPAWLSATAADKPARPAPMTCTWDALNDRSSGTGRGRVGGRCHDRAI